MHHGVFVSYRRADTAGHAGRICGDLERYFGAAVVFRDIDSIRAGSDFVKALEAAIQHAGVVIVLIGDSWLSEASDDGAPRLHDPEDHVHREVAMALGDSSVTVVPVLMDGASMPTERELPQPLRQLARLQAIEVSDSRWEYDIERLVRVLEAAGIHQAEAGARLPAWFAPLAGAVVVVAIAAFVWCWQASTASVDDYAGLWHLPNGSFWTIRERDGQLWVEETHHDSRQVWKRGPGTFDSDGLAVELELVFGREPFRFLHRLSLSEDRQSLIGSVRRSDLASESSLVLTRGAQHRRVQ